MTDINPMWRIKTLTETFGICGIGWKYTIDKQWLETFGNEISAFCNITLYIKVDGIWSDGIPGTGGSMFVSKEKSGAYVSDECYKMALTDAISVSAKAIGVGADVYWAKDKTKYDNKIQENTHLITEAQGKRLFAISNGNIKLAKEILLKYNYTTSKEIKKIDYNNICKELEEAIKTERIIEEEENLKEVLLSE
jgi:hypothetical protein